jgi:hypothetical protein
MVEVPAPKPRAGVALHVTSAGVGGVPGLATGDTLTASVGAALAGFVDVADGVSVAGVLAVADGNAEALVDGTLAAPVHPESTSTRIERPRGGRIVQSCSAVGGAHRQQPWIRATHDAAHAGPSQPTEKEPCPA